MWEADKVAKSRLWRGMVLARFSQEVEEVGWELATERGRWLTRS
jgi:hypothetical protein